NTTFGTKIDNAIFALVHRGDRADRYTGRILAVITSSDLKYAAGIGKSSLLDIFHPRAVDSEGHVVLRFAGHGTGVATDAFAIIDDEPVSHWEGKSPGSPEKCPAAWVLYPSALPGGIQIVTSQRQFFAIDV